MSSEIVVAGVHFVSVKEAATGVDISADYIGRLCRKGVVHGRLEDREWYVNPDSLAAWRADQARRKDEQHQKTRELRKQERANGHDHTAQSAITVAPRRELNARFQSHIKKARRLRMLGTVVLVTCLLFSTALAFEIIAPPNSTARATLKNNFAAAHDQLAAAASLPFVDALASNVFNTLCPFFRNCPESKSQLIARQIPPTRNSRTATTATSSPQTLATSPTPPRLTTVINQPVIERVKETVRTVIEGGINASYVDARITALQQSLAQQIATVAASSHSESQTIYQTVGMVGRIEELSNTKLHSPTIDGATITGGSITAASISGTITAAINSAAATIVNLTSTTLTATNATTTNLYVAGTATLATPLSISSGGTGTSSAPSYGKVLVGNSSGGYELTATSSLGISGGSGSPGGSDTQVQYNNAGAFAGSAAFTFSQSGSRLNATFASTTAASSYDGLFVGRTATTTILGSATSTFGAGIQTTALNITSSSASSTFANGLNLSAGCFAINGTCVGGSGSGTVTSITAGSGLSGGTITTSGTLSLNLANANTWTALQQFTNASTSLFSAYGPAYFGATATSSFSSAGILTLTNLNGPLDARNGLVGVKRPAILTPDRRPILTPLDRELVSH